MGEVRACVYIFVTLLSFQVIAAKPFFGLGMWCSLLCDDYDSSDESSYDYGLCDGCPKSHTQSHPQSSPASPVSPGAHPGQLSLVIPPANGVNLTLSNMGGSFLLDMVPWSPTGTAPVAAPAGAPAAAPAPAATPAPAAPAATTAAAAAAATTAATTAAATTAAATTAAAGK